jgi:hypothetical protein
MWELLLLMAVGTAAQNSTVTPSTPSSAAAAPPNKPTVGLSSPPPLVGLAGPFNQPIIGASGLGQPPRFGPDKSGKQLLMFLFLLVQYLQGKIHCVFFFSQETYVCNPALGVLIPAPS